MLNAIRFVQGAVARKDFVPSLRHFHIADNRITAYNGVVALSSPIDLAITATPKAEQFGKAIAACKDKVSLTVTTAGRIGIRSGTFRAFIECTDEPFPVVMPTGQPLPLNGAFMQALHRVSPFISDDASRAWSLGVLFQGKSLIATNNVIAVQAWVGQDAPFARTVAIPKEAIYEMLRINEEPTGYQLDDTGMTLHYENGRWLQTRLLSTGWPDVIGLLDAVHGEATTFADKGEEILPALETLAPFLDADNRVYYGHCLLSTHRPGNDAQGASVDIAATVGAGVFNHAMLTKVARVATKMDLSHENGPRCPFVAEGLRGVIIGYRN